MARRQIVWFFVGFAAATLYGAVLTAPSARAQEASGRTRTTRQGGPTLPSRGSPNPTDLDDSFAPPGIPEAIPEDDPSRIPEEQDGLDPQPAAGQRPVVQDGDPNFPPEPLQARDGVIDTGEPAAPTDGTDPSVVDTRPLEDVEPFLDPSAGADPFLFQVEDINPILENRRLDRLFRAEPFDPIGIKIGSFVLFPELETSGNYFSNVFRAPNARSDVTAEVRPTARLVSNWNAHALELRAASAFSFYKEFDTENEKDYTLETRGRLDISRRTNIEGLISRDQVQESRSALDASAVGSRSNAITDRAEGSFNHRFNRLAVQVRGSVADFSFGDVVNAGIVGSNADRDYKAYEETVRASWEFKPTLMAFAEVAVNQRNYDLAAASDLINRSSAGERYRAGLSFGNTGNKLRGEVSLGYGIQTPGDSRLKSLDGLIIDANATWRATELTSFLFNARSDVSETSTTNVGGAFFRFLSLEARHALRRYLIASAGLSYANQDSQDGVIDETELRATLGLEYHLNREAMLFSRYAHTSFDAVGAASDYESDEVKIGLRLRR